MASSGASVSEEIIYTVADALDADPMDLPPLEETISADALDTLFHEDEPLPGASTVFPYSDVWVVVHGDRTVDVFRGFAATNAVEDLPEGVEEPTTDERVVLLQEADGRYALHGEDLEEAEEVVEETEDPEDAWVEAVEHAEDE